MKKSMVAVIIGVKFALGAVLYVDAGANSGGSGTISQPYQQVQRALDNSSEGDTIYLREGLYEQGELEIRTNNLTIASYPGEWAHLRNPYDDSDIQYVMRYAIPITAGRIDRLEMQGGYYYALKFESNWNWDNSVPFDERKGASGITISNSKLHGSGRDCVKITPACNDISFLNCEISNSGQRDDSNAEGIDNVNGANMVVRDCYIHDIATNGIYAKGGAKSALIENNVIMNCGLGGVMTGFYTDAEWFNSDENPEYFESISSTVRNNYIINTGGAGLGFYGSFNAKAYNNTLIKTATVNQASIIMATGDIWLSSTTTLQPKNRDAWIVNNIIANDATSEELVEVRDSANEASCMLDYNLYYTTGDQKFDLDDYQQWPAMTFAEYVEKTPYGQHSLFADPLLDDNYHLAAGSPAVDTGYSDSVVFHDYDGDNRLNRWDIGADEYGLNTGKKVPPVWNDSGATAIELPQPMVKTILSPVMSIRELQLITSGDRSNSVMLFSLQGRKISLSSSQDLTRLNSLGDSFFIARVGRAGSVQTVKVVKR